MAAEILSKTNMFSPVYYCSSHLSSSSFKKSSITVTSSLKIQPLKSSLSTEFHGRKISLQQLEGKEPRKGNFHALPIQVCFQKLFMEFFFFLGFLSVF